MNLGVSETSSFQPSNILKFLLRRMATASLLIIQVEQETKSRVKTLITASKCTPLANSRVNLILFAMIFLTSEHKDGSCPLDPSRFLMARASQSSRRNNMKVVLKSSLLHRTV